MSDLSIQSAPYPFYIDAVDKRGRSLLPDGIGLKLDVNPQSLDISWGERYAIESTFSGYLKTEWPSMPSALSISTATGVFYTRYGITPHGDKARRSVSYDNWMDWLALYKSNACLFDADGQIAYQGKIKVSWSGFTAYGLFESFSVSKSADNPYNMEFELTMSLSKVQLKTGKFASK
jgi:hypothetical protein